MAGDPMQLGPVIRSKLAKGHNFDLSLLERLVDMPIYARDEDKFVDHGAYNPLLVNISKYMHFSVHLHQVHFISFVSTIVLMLYQIYSKVLPQKSKELICSALY